MPKLQYKYTALYCRDCEVDFVVKRLDLKKYCCPVCGEHRFVQKLRDLSLKLPFVHGRYWTKDEIDILKIGIKQGYSYKQIEAALEGRTVSSISTKVWQLRKEGYLEGS